MKSLVCAIAIVVGTTPVAILGDERPVMVFTPQKPYLPLKGGLSASDARAWSSFGRQPSIEARSLRLDLSLKYSQTYLMELYMHRTTTVNVELGILSRRTGREPGRVSIPIPGDHVRFWFKTANKAPDLSRLTSRYARFSADFSRTRQYAPVQPHARQAAQIPLRTRLLLRVSGPEGKTITVYSFKVFEWNSRRSPYGANLPLMGPPVKKSKGYIHPRPY